MLLKCLPAVSGLGWFRSVQVGSFVGNTNQCGYRCQALSTYPAHKTLEARKQRQGEFDAVVD